MLSLTFPLPLQFLRQSNSKDNQSFNFQNKVYILSGEKALWKKRSRILTDSSYLIKQNLLIRICQHYSNIVFAAFNKHLLILMIVIHIPTYKIFIYSSSLTILSSFLISISSLHSLAVSLPFSFKLSVSFPHFLHCHPNIFLLCFF